MRKQRILNKFSIASVTAMLFIVPLFAAGCDSSTIASEGVSQEEYDQVTADLDAAQSRIEELEDELDALQDDQDTLTDWYLGIREEVNQRLGDWGNEKLFITPDDEDIAAKVQELTGGFSENINEQWTDYAAMYYWVANNIEYNSDSRLPHLPLVNGDIFWSHDYWRMPAETMEDGVGDCEDMATLLASMILNYTSSEGYPCWCITWSSDESGHVAVAIPVDGDRLSILDPAGHYYTSPSYGLGNDDIAAAVNDWITHWQPEPGIHVDCVFSDTLYETFDSTEEFIEWALAE